MKTRMEISEPMKRAGFLICFDICVLCKKTDINSFLSTNHNIRGDKMLVSEKQKREMEKKIKLDILKKLSDDESKFAENTVNNILKAYIMQDSNPMIQAFFDASKT